MTNFWQIHARRLPGRVKGLNNNSNASSIIPNNTQILNAIPVTKPIVKAEAKSGDRPELTSGSSSNTLQLLVTVTPKITILNEVTTPTVPETPTIAVHLPRRYTLPLFSSPPTKKHSKFLAILQSPVIDLDALRKTAWSGIPDDIRPIVWMLLMGYLPANSDRRDAALDRKRKEYSDFAASMIGDAGTGNMSATGTGGGIVDGDEQQLLRHQIHIDIQRTNSHILLYRNLRVQEALERILFCWAIRHPASGYVQGINDLATPFFQVFVSASIDVEDAESIATMSTSTLSQIEADSFWCLTKLLDGIQDNYTFSQPGIQRQVGRLNDLVQRIDAPLAVHLASQGVQFIQFAFRWMNCLLMREVSLPLTIRMWDTYQSEGSNGFSDFHLYVCAAFLVKWTENIKAMEFAEILVFLQGLDRVTKGWGHGEIEVLLSEAFMLKSFYHDSPSHTPSISL